MDVEQIYAEAECFYEQFEQSYGIYMHLELDLSYVYNRIEQYLHIGMEPEEVLESIKSMIIGAADAAAEAQDS